MPVFNLRCRICGRPRKAIRSPGWAFNLDPWLTCEDCNAQDFVREVQAPTITVKEVVDSGAQVKALERLADVERLHDERLEIENAIAKGKDPDITVR